MPTKGGERALGERFRLINLEGRLLASKTTTAAVAEAAAATSTTTAAATTGTQDVLARMLALFRRCYLLASAIAYVHVQAPYRLP